jgi:cysteine synthase
MVNEIPASLMYSLGNNILLKLECNNPGGSHKTRAARRIINNGIKEGKILPGVTTVIEKTGGNFGFGLIVACREYNLPVELVVGLSYSKLKRHCLVFSGAELVGQEMLANNSDPLTVIETYIENSVNTGKHYFYPDQFNNTNNIEAHEKDTGAELVQQLRYLPDIENILFVACAGTGASITGVTRALKYHGYNVDTVLVEPRGCNSINGVFVDHKMEGMSVGISPPLIDWELISYRVEVEHDEMLKTQAWFLNQSGYFIGNTSAACLSVARSLEKKKRKEKQKIVCLAYDLGHWYLNMDCQ